MFDGLNINVSDTGVGASKHEVLTGISSDVFETPGGATYLAGWTKVCSVAATAGGS